MDISFQSILFSYTSLDKSEEICTDRQTHDKSSYRISDGYVIEEMLDRRYRIAEMSIYRNEIAKCGKEESGDDDQHHKDTESVERFLFRLFRYD